MASILQSGGHLFWRISWLRRSLSLPLLAMFYWYWFLGMIGKFVTTGVGHMRDRNQIKSKTKDNKMWMCFMFFRVWMVLMLLGLLGEKPCLRLRERGRTNTGSYTTPTISGVCCALSASSCSTGHIMATVSPGRGIERKKCCFSAQKQWGPGWNSLSPQYVKGPSRIWLHNL